jgi:hypothetical protein
MAPGAGFSALLQAEKRNAQKEKVRITFIVKTEKNFILYFQI